MKVGNNYGEVMFTLCSPDMWVNINLISNIFNQIFFSCFVLLCNVSHFKFSFNSLLYSAFKKPPHCVPSPYLIFSILFCIFTSQMLPTTLHCLLWASRFHSRTTKPSIHSKERNAYASTHGIDLEIPYNINYSDTLLL